MIVDGPSLVAFVVRDFVRLDVVWCSPSVFGPFRRFRLRSLFAFCFGKKNVKQKTRLVTDGSPQLTACWGDESDNKLLKSVAQGSHPSVFHRRVLASWEDMQRVANDR